MWLPRLADKNGRKKMYHLGMILNVIVYAVMLSVPDFWVTWACIFLFGCLNSLRTAIGFIYLQELIPARSQTAATTIIFINDGLVYTFQIIYYWKISTHSFPLICVGFGIALVGAIIPFFLPESPVYLLGLGRIEEALTVMRKIARWNNSEQKLDEKVDEIRD